MGLRPFPPCLYALRHGGVVDDKASFRRFIQAMSNRGRWKSQTSDRRYEKEGGVGVASRAMPRRFALVIIRQARGCCVRAC
eukprot:792668-Lingulodinium_polyedra.AAC.1